MSTIPTPSGDDELPSAAPSPSPDAASAAETAADEEANTPENFQAVFGEPFPDAPASDEPADVAQADAPDGSVNEPEGEADDVAAEPSAFGPGVAPNTPPNDDLRSYESIFGVSVPATPARGALASDGAAPDGPADGVSTTPDSGPAAPTKPASQRGVARELIETLLLAALIFVLVRSVILNFRVDGNSMLPNLHNGELVLVNHQAYAAWDLGDVVDWIPGIDASWVVTPFGDPVRGDIVIFNPPDDDKPYIKRVIGLPGDVVEFAGGDVYVNGLRLEEPYIQTGITRCPGGICDEPIVVPEGHIFVLGDNRRNSEDSRYFGPITIDSVIGKAVLVYWPLSSLSTLPEPDYAFVPAE